MPETRFPPPQDRFNKSRLAAKELKLIWVERRCFVFVLSSPVFCARPAIADPILAPATVLTQLALRPTGDASSCFAPQGTEQQDCVTTLSPGGVSLSLSGDATATLSAVTSYGSDPSVSNEISVIGTLDARTQYISTSDIAYYFEVIGPQNATAEVSIAAEANTSANRPLTGFLSLTDSAFLAVDIPTQVGFIYSQNAANGGPFNVDQELTVNTNTIYQVVTQSIESLVNSGSTAAPIDLTSSASVDPTITLDTTDPAYSLALSPAPVPTPEPNYLALTGACLAIRLLVVRRRGRDLLA
jgi:hypothetical protein